MPSIEIIVVSKNEFSYTIRIHYLIILLIINYFTIDSALIIYQHCILEGECAKVINSTRLFTHRTFPPSFWYQGDIIMTIGLLMTIATCIVLLFTNHLNPRYCFYAIEEIDSKETGRLFYYERRMVPIPIARRMIRYRLIGRKIANQITIAIFLVVYIFFVQAVFINSYYQINDLIFYFLILPVVLFNIILVSVLVISLGIIDLKYVQIRQWFLMYKQIGNLNVNYSINKNYQHKLISLRRISKSIIHIGSSIESYNQFWSPILTIDFIGYSLIVGYLIYSFFFKQTIGLEKYFFSICTVFDTLYLMNFINEYAKIACNNIIIENKYRGNLFKLLWSDKINFHLKLKVCSNVLNNTNNFFIIFFLFFLVR